MVTISVVLATFNGERYIAQQLESISRQTRLPDELIISDDNSSDKTIEIVHDWKDHLPFPTKIIKNPYRLGIPHNFFSAIAYATGDLIALCDQDDLWHPNKLRIMEQEFKNPKISCVVHTSIITDSTLHSLNKKQPLIKRVTSLVPGHFPPMKPLPGRNMMLRASAAQDCIKLFNLFPRKKSPCLIDSIGHDTFITFVLTSCSYVKLLPNILSYYRIHSDNTSQLSSEISLFSRIKSRSYPKLLQAAIENEIQLCQEILNFFKWVNLNHQTLTISLPPISPIAINNYQQFYAIARRRLDLIKSSSFSTRLTTLIGNVLRGDYTNSNGYGFRSLLRDLQVLFFELSSSNKLEDSER